ncbi:hypothetical protein VaNZ11_009272 [Volvox africanus]|uniref:RING-CH-type domain-containing protein n=1 Tax=Volvox africanus TaxID=51714 RepID=A0ABQ5S8A9_9CHLO|nr:hypothetical protein VaNZ11_009272 [Volvox africanus]
MKLRKATKSSLLDLDDPLATDSDDSEYDCLSDIAEEDEEDIESEESEDVDDTEGNVAARVLKQDIEDDISADILNRVAHDAVSGQRFSCSESDNDTQDVQNTEHLYDDGREQEEKGAEHQQQQDEWEEGREVKDDGLDEDDDEGGAVNPFAILAMSVWSDSEEGQVMRLAPSPHGGNAGGDSTEEDYECEGPPRMDMDVRRQYSHAGRGKQRQHCGDGGCGATTAAAATVTTATPVTAPQPQPSEFADLASRGLHHTKDGDGDEDEGSAYGDGEESDAQEEDEECSTPECWLCYGKGRAACHKNAATVNGSEDGGGGRPRGSSCSVVASTAPGAASCADGNEGGGNDTEDELAMPCRTCSGGLRYIHRGCFRRWLDSSWAIACPNCRTLYDRAVLESISCSPSVPSMLLAACPPVHDLRQPLPPGAHVYFCIGGAVELSMPCGGFAAGELLRRIRFLVDDIAAAGVDGGVGLMGPDGCAMQLTSFEVTGLTLDTEGSRSRESGGERSAFMDLPPMMPGRAAYDEVYHEWRRHYEQQEHRVRELYDNALIDVAGQRLQSQTGVGTHRGRSSVMTAADHRARSRLEQQRLAAGLHFQQRNHQRHAHERGQRAALGAPRGGGGRRRS